MKIIKNLLNFAKKHCILIVFAAFALCSCNANKSAQISERFAFDSAQNVDFSSREKFADYAKNLENGDFTKGNLHKCSERDIDYMLDMLSYAKKPEHLELFEKTLEEKASRLPDIDRISWYLHILQKSYMDAGLPQKAYALREKYSKAHSISLPEKLEDLSGGRKGWLAYAIKDGGNTLAIVDTGLDKGEHIVVTGYWGIGAFGSFGEISQSVWLRRVFFELGTIVADGFSRQWQQLLLEVFPMERIYSRFSHDDMAVLDRPESPTFYFLKDGNIVYSFTGIKKGDETGYLGQHFRKGLVALYGENGADRFSGIEKKPLPQLKMPEEKDIPQEEFERLAHPKAPFYLDYGKVLERAQPWQALKFINRAEIYKGCLAAGNFSGIAQQYSPEDYDRIAREMDFCKPLLGYQAGSRENAKMADLLQGVSPESRIEFARSIITKDGHIISAYLGGIEKDLGKAKAKEIAAEIAKTLAGDNIQYGFSCEIEESPGGDSPKQLARTEKEGHFCTAE